MKRIHLSLMLGACLSIPALAQQKEEQVPYSWTDSKITSEITAIEFARPDVANLLKEDEENMKNGKAFRVGVNFSANVSPATAGTWDFLPDGSVIWRVKLTSAGAYALSLSCPEFHLPEGSALYLYNEDRSHVVGPFSSEDNSEDGFYSSPLVNGSSLIVEYNQPAGVTGQPFAFAMSDLAYFYRQEAVFRPRDTKDFGESETCEVNINCSEGTAWNDEKRAVARLLLKEGSDFFFCSGALINNTLQDCTPYLLTAQHCGTGASHVDMRSWKFYFNYESPSCTDPASEGSLANQVITGCVKLAASGNTSTINRSDFQLVVLRGRPSPAFNSYLAGWDRTNIAPSSGVSIHHPSGDIKKISTYTVPLTTTSWDGTPNTHWRVFWDNTANGHGVTEGGSSGSPIFSAAGLVIGDLSGGSSFCTNPNNPDSYGKFSYSWESCGTTDDRRLKPWLDRNASSVTSLNGKNNDCSAAVTPTVNFDADDTWPVVNQTVFLTDLSDNSPFYWQWNISPSTFTFVNGTSATSQHPQVQFSATGNYTVTLYAVNSAGYGYKLWNNYIHVGFVGVEEEEESMINLYPNPSAGSFVVSVEPGNLDADNLVLAVQDLQGKTLYTVKNPTLSGNLLQVNLPGTIAGGMYLITLSDSKYRVVKRIEVIR